MQLPSGEEIPLPPIILGHLGSDPAKKTVCIYGHLDVQPAHIDDGWDTEPFTLVEKDGERRTDSLSETKHSLPVVEVDWNAVQAYLHCLLCNDYITLFLHSANVWYHFCTEIKGCLVLQRGPYHS